MRHHDREVADKYWRTTKEATQIVDAIVYDDDIALLDLMARAAKGEKVIEADQQEDAEYFETSAVLSGRIA